MKILKILLLEDEKPIQKVVRLTLELRRHELDIASDVKEATELFEAMRLRGLSYDLIICDVGVPGPSGFALAGYVRGAGYNGRLAMFTGTEAEFANMSIVDAEYWPKAVAIGNLIERVEMTK